MATIQEVGATIARNQLEFNKLGVVTVRPGYKLDTGWPVGDPIIVIFVSSQQLGLSSSALPTEVEGVPVEVREASTSHLLRAQNPQAFAALQDRALDEELPPVFPGQVEFTANGMSVAPLAAAAKSSGKTEIDYTGVAGKPLEPVTATFELTCHASPDAGWPTLKDFFSRIEDTLTVGMYDLTSAHVLQALDAALSSGEVKPLTLVLDDPKKNPTADQTDPESEQKLDQTLGDKLTFNWAAVRSSPMTKAWIFPSAYHIKVAVRDSKEIWLSSGNWNNSNQPDPAPAFDQDAAEAAATFKKSDRDWHLIVPHAGLAELYEEYIKHDCQAATAAQKGAGITSEAPLLEALAAVSTSMAEFHPAAAATKAPVKYFKPQTINGEMTIQPLLTPDPGSDGVTTLYCEQMLKLISGAESKLYIQLQYIHPSDMEGDAPFMKLLDAVTARAKAGVDVRIILSQWQNSQWMERLKASGFDTDLVRIQQGVHNKGFLVDDKNAVVSSMNWSSQGCLENRDAGMIVTSADVYSYFEEIFLHDWNNVAVSHQTAREMAFAISSTATAPVLAQVLGWQDDPGSVVPPQVPPEPRPVPNLSAAPLALTIAGTAPSPAEYPVSSASFRFWSAAEAAARGASLWRSILPSNVQWYTGRTLNMLLDEGEDLNAYYDRRALNFFHGIAGGRTVYSGESPDVVCHEQGHAILDAIKPELFNAGSNEVAAFHEAFGDMSAILAALQVQSMREAVLQETGGDLSRSSRLSRLAEQLGWAIRQGYPTAVDPDCLRNAANNFFYVNPDTLPPSGTASALSSEPHSFSRVFSGAFLEAIAGGVHLTANATEADLAKVAIDLAELLIHGVLAAPVVPEFMTQVAAAIIAADASAPGTAQNRYSQVLRSAFMRHGIISPQSSVKLSAFQASGMATVNRPMSAAAAPLSGDQSPELPTVALSGSEYGLGDVPLLIRLTSGQRRFAVAAAAFGPGQSSPSASEQTARAFVEDLMQRGHLDVSTAEGAAIAGPRRHIKTHRLQRTSKGYLLSRILFDCGWSAFR